MPEYLQRNTGRGLLVLCAFISLLLLPWMANAAKYNKRAVAVIIGNSNYQGRTPKVDYAGNDADAFKKYVIDVLRYDPENIIDLRDATKTQMEAAFGNHQTAEGKLWRYIDPKGRSDVTVFYSGHGVPGLKDKRGYLLPVDADPEEQSSSSETTEILEPVRYEEGALHLILAYAQEPTSVTLTFNSVPFVDPTLAPNAFKIIDSNGLPLRIAGLYIKDHTILVRTETQVKDEMYQVLLSEPLMEIRGGSLDATNRTASFQGHIDGVSVRTPSPDPIVAPVPMPVVPSEQPCDPRSVANPPSVTNLRLRSVAQTNGTHNVDARWSVAAGTCQPLLSYLVRQSNDRGRTFTQPQVVPAGTDGIDIPGVHAGEYGIGVSVVSPQGGVSKEVFARIELPISGNSAVIVPEIIITETPAPPTYISPIVSGNKRPLPSTGAGILIGGLSALGGAAIIRKKTRKQKK